MIRATHIRMKQSYFNSSTQSLEAKLLEIDKIYLTGLTKDDWYPKDKVHDFVNSGSTIFVNITPYPKLIAAVSKNKEKYVRSSPNESTSDNLLSLPRG